jgi:hypothetical protein
MPTHVICSAMKWSRAGRGARRSMAARSPRTQVRCCLARALLLGATDRAIGLVTRFEACFADGRAQAQVEHSIAAMVAQRVLGIRARL